MTHANSTAPDRIAIAGAGSIGVRLAAAWLAAGFEVALFDPDGTRREAAVHEIASAAEEIVEAGLAATDPALLSRLSVHDSLSAAAEGAVLAIECGPERVEIKRDIAQALLAAMPQEAILASASSALTASEIAEPLPEKDRSRCLIAHPVNPPHLIRLLEIVPAPFTDPATVEAAIRLAGRAGFTPVEIRREITGFVYNRLQGAVLREAYCLVRDGVIGVEALDRLVREALGFRWSVLGPFETVDLNTRGGIEAHAARLGPAYAKMGAERGQHDPWTSDLVERVAGERRALLPLDEWEKAVAARDRELVALSRFRTARKEG